MLPFDHRPASETPFTGHLWIYALRTNQHFTLLALSSLDHMRIIAMGISVYPEGFQIRNTSGSTAPRCAAASTNQSTICG